MQKRDFETYQKRFRDFEILPKFSKTHVFQGTIRHPWQRFLHFYSDTQKKVYFILFARHKSNK